MDELLLLLLLLVRLHRMGRERCVRKGLRGQSRSGCRCGRCLRKVAVREMLQVLQVFLQITKTAVAEHSITFVVRLSSSVGLQHNIIQQLCNLVHQFRVLHCGLLCGRRCGTNRCSLRLLCLSLHLCLRLKLGLDLSLGL